MDLSRCNIYSQTSSNHTSGYQGQHFRRQSYSIPLAGTQIQTNRVYSSRSQMRRTLPIHPSIVTYIPPISRVLTQSRLVLPMFNTPSTLSALPCPMAYAPEHIPPVLPVPHSFPVPPPSHQIPNSFPFPPPVFTLLHSFSFPPPSPQIPISFPFPPPPLQVSPTPLPQSPSFSQTTPNIAQRKLSDEDRYRLMVSLPVGHREDGTYGVLPDLPDNESYSIGLYYADLTYHIVPGKG